MIKFLKILAYFFLTIFGIIVLALIFTQTGWFKNIVKEKAVEIANESLNGKLSLGEIDGTFFGGLQISDIKIEQNNSTIIYCKEIDLDYSIIGLLSSSIDINSAVIDSLYLHLKQVNDTTWNVSQLVKSSPDTTASTPFTWTVDLDLFKIKNSNIEITSFDTVSNIPEQINKINLSLSALYSTENKNVEVEHFSFITEKPDLELKDLLLSAEMENDEIYLENLSIQTAENKITAVGKYFIDDSEESEIHLETTPINFHEFKAFLPDIEINGNPILTLDGKYFKSNAEVKLNIEENEQSLVLDASAKDINTYPSYKAELKINNINAAHWLNDPSMKTDVNGSLTVDGSGLSIEDINAKAILNIVDSELLNRHLNSLTLNADINKDNLESQIKLTSEFGKLNADVSITDMSNTQKFRLNAEIEKLNTAPLLLNDSLQSNINLTLSANGQNFDPDLMTGSVSLSADTSSFTNYSIDSLTAKVNINRSNYIVDTLYLQSQIAEMSGSGTISKNASSDLTFTIIPKDLSDLPQLKTYESLNVEGEIKGKLTGNLDSLSAKVDYDFKNFIFQTNNVEKIRGSAEVISTKDSLKVLLDTELDKILASDIAIQKVNLNANYSGDKVASDLFITINDTASAELQSTVMLDSIITVFISKMKLDISEYTWQNQNDSISVTIGEDEYKVNNFDLSNGEQSININGTASLNDSSDLKVSLENLNVGEFANLIQSDVNVSAIVNANLNLSGSLSQPIAEGNLEIDNINYNDNKIGDVKTEFELKNEKLNWDFELQRGNNKILSNGFIPILINADSSQSIIPGDRELSINLKIDTLNMSELPNFNKQFDKIEGTISSDMRLMNSLNNLHAAGYFTINNAVIESEVLGITYDKLNLNFVADSTENKFYLKEFTIHNGDGNLKIEGFLGYPDGLLSGAFDPLEVNLEANEFEVAENENYEAKIDGDIKFRNEAGEAKFSGEITLIRSRVYLPFFTESDGKDFDQSKPLLIKELEETAKDTVGIKAEKMKEDTVKSTPFLKEINGRFELIIPKNTWIVSPQINVELSGDVEVVKTGSIIELYGNVSVKRGKIEVYGKEFNVTEGRIIFTGGSELNPELALTLEYMIRGANRTKQYLQISVTGTAAEPKLSFSLDGSEIDEGNAMSYIIFGKSMDQLTQGERSNVESNDTNLAKTLAGNFLAAKVSSTVGDALGLDVIEIRGGDNWEGATLTAGKYLTDNLYVSYERGFGSTETNEVSPRIVTAEYEITKYLFFQLVEGNDKSAGFDIIIKFDW